MGRKTVLLAMLLSLLSAGTSFADTYQTEVTNNVGIGDINISLAEYGLDESGRESPYENGRIVLPGEKVDKIVRITNEANTAWIRAKLEYTSEDGIKGLSDEMVTLSGEGWKKIEDYYYYLKPVEKGSSVDFIDKLRIPTEWDGTYASKSFAVVITADAVQTENFTPDFNSQDPWFGTVIEACVHTAYETEYVGQETFQVAFEGGAAGMVRVGDDFFANWGQLMPGDTVTDKVTLKNGYRRAVSLHFRTETIADDALLKALSLEIKSGDEVVYSGTLDGAVKDAVEVARLKSGEEKSLTYTLHVPNELDNQYALSQTKTKWIFSARVNTSSSGGGGQGRPGVDKGQATTKVPPLPPAIQEVVDKAGDFVGNLPKLGDDVTPQAALLLMIASGIGIICTSRKKRRKKEEKRNE